MRLSISCVCAAILSVTNVVGAQVTGTLSGQKGMLAGSPSPSDLSTFAALVFDPTLTSIARSSAWAFNVIATSSEKEARVQANLCDLGALKGTCGTDNAILLAFAGPISKSGTTELADLNGLAGQARLEGGFTANVGHAGWTFGAQGEYAKPQFDFRDSLTLAARSAGASAFSVAGSLGWKSDKVSLNAGLRWEQSQKESSEQNLCSPAGFGPTGTQVCRDLVVGGPQQSRTSVASVDLAYSVGYGAAHVVVSRDLSQHLLGVDIPVYLFANGTGGLAGGVRGGYRSDTRRFTIALFVGEFKL